MVTFLCQLVPYLIYLNAWRHYVSDMVYIMGLRRSSPTADASDDLRRTEPNLLTKCLIWLSGRLTKVWDGFKVAALTLLICATSIYLAMLCISVLITIRDSGLPSSGDLADPGQLLPFVTGIVALVSAFANCIDGLSFSKMEVRKERLPNGRFLRFYEGVDPPDEHIPL